MIHLLTGEYPPSPGGVSDYSARIAHALADSGQSIHVWAPGRSGDVFEGRVAAHRIAGRFWPWDLFRLGRALETFPGPRRLLVQWTPHSFGLRSLNLAFPVWLWIRARLRRDRVELMVHEPFLAFGEGNWRRNAAAALHRVMIAILLDAASRVWVSIPAWERALRPWSLRSSLPCEWLPVPSNISGFTPPAVALRAATAGKSVIGHFGTFRDDIAALLEPALRLVLTRSNAVILLAGSGSRRFRERLAYACPGATARVIATGTLASASLAGALSLCDVLVQPYPDGVSSRRGTAMAALRLGVPIVTNLGPLSERFWNPSRAVHLARSTAPDDLASAAFDLLRDSDLRAETGNAARRLYEDLFDLRYTIAALERAGRFAAQPSRFAA